MFKKILVAAASSTIALSAFAAYADRPQQSVPLKDGSTAHIFADGKMGMENSFGNATETKQGHVMETKDGRTIVMNGNEVVRVDLFLGRNSVGTP